MHSSATIVILVAALVAVAGPGVGAAAEPNFSVAMPTPAVGDVLVYQGSYVTVACSRWQTVATNQNGFTVSRCGDDTAYFIASTGALARITGKDGKDLVSFKPGSPTVQFPLQVGKTWTASYAGFTADNQANWNSVQACRVLDWETVQVPAGALAAFRIICDDHWTSGGASGESAQTTWYAPQAHAVVKTVNQADPKWDMQLASYTLH